MVSASFLFWLILLMLVIGLGTASIRIFREYERGVVFTLGRFWQVKGPGLIFIIPAIQQVVRVDLRTVVLEVPAQDVISRDNVSVKVNAVIYLRVVDAEKAVIQVVNYLEATSQLAQTMLRSVLGGASLAAGFSTLSQGLGYDGRVFCWSGLELQLWVAARAGKACGPQLYKTGRNHHQKGKRGQRQRLHRQPGTGRPDQLLRQGLRCGRHRV